MVQRPKTAGAQKQFWLGLVPLISLSGITCLRLGSQSFAATPQQISVTIAQQPENSDAAEQAYQEALQLFEQGTLESLQQAHLKFKEALEGFQASDDRAGIGRTLGYLGFISDDLGEYRQAIEYFKQALEIFQFLGKRTDEMTALVRIGFAYSELGEFEQTIAYAREALPLVRETADKTKEAHVLALMGRAYQELRQPEQAIASFDRAVTLYREVNDLANAANIFETLGTIYYRIGDNQKALEQLQQSLPLWQATGETEREVLTLKTMAGQLLALGNYQQALDYYNQGLTRAQTLADRSITADLLWVISQLYLELGDSRSSLVYLNRALALQESLNNPASRATILGAIGFTYYVSDDFEQALSYYNQALPLWRQLNNREEEAKLLNDIGTIHYWNYELYGIGNVHQGLDALKQALAIFQAEGIKRQEADTLGQLALYYSYLEDKDQALEYLDRAIALAPSLEELPMKALLMKRIAGVYDALSDHRNALDFSGRALELYRMLGDKSGEASALAELAKTERNLGNLTAARDKIKAAIDIIEDLRTKIGSQDLRTSYFATVQDYYGFYIDLLMQLHQQNPSQGYNALALHISERARARSLLEQLTEAGLDLKADLDPALAAEEQRLTQALNAADQKRINLLASSASNEELAATIAEIDDILNQLQNLEAQIRRDNPAYANIKYPDPLTLDGIQTQILDDNTLLLQYALGTERSYLFLVSKTELKTYQLPPKAEIEAAVEEYRQLLLSPNFTDLSQGQNLSQMLLGQVAGELQGQRLVIVGDGKLQLLPFAALPWGSGASLAPLLANHEIITLPSVTSLAVQREQWRKREQAPNTLAVIADPVFKASDSRLGENATNAIAGDLGQIDSLIRNSCGDFDRLPNTAIEAEQILALVPDAQEFSALGFDANYAAATSPNLSQYRIVHLATHGCIQDNPLLSNLALSFFNADGQRVETSLLKLQDIYDLELNAELVVLSACQTGTGKDVRGEGIVGLTRGFMYAGARRVAVSLWSVNDRATSILMSDYYRQMLEGGINPTAALRQAQLTLWQSGNYSAPYYWAAFTIQGDW